MHLCNLSPQRGDWYCNPGWRPDEERSSDERLQPGDVKLIQTGYPEAMGIEKD
ncbi:hypothetical protein L6773_21070 [Rhodohalobacter sp. WB101]|uniref:Uncharacterized protein n=1 Tax=Rhodohalobacter sulfatireducens TaxID=2911366 RepID=A0ABS9KJS0_9BACT|nr:hypothetical protein [Rhodohalobacter sulfatireducens]